MDKSEAWKWYCLGIADSNRVIDFIREFEERYENDRKSV